MCLCRRSSGSLTCGQEETGSVSIVGVRTVQRDYTVHETNGGNCAHFVPQGHMHRALLAARKSSNASLLLICTTGGCRYAFMWESNVSYSQTPRPYERTCGWRLEAWLGRAG